MTVNDFSDWFTAGAGTLFTDLSHMGDWAEGWHRRVFYIPCRVTNSGLQAYTS